MTPALLGMALAGAIISAMMWIVIAYPSFFTSQGALLIAKTVTLFKAIIVVLDRVPYAAINTAAPVTAVRISAA